MKMFLVLVLSVAALFVWQRQGKDAGTLVDPPTEMGTPAALTTSSPVATVSERNWAKNSLDRTQAVMDQVRQSRQQDEQP